MIAFIKYVKVLSIYRHLKKAEKALDKPFNNKASIRIDKLIAVKEALCE